MHDNLNKHCINVASSIITNGYHLSLDNFKLLCSLGITQFQITLDGEREFHDKRRPLTNGQGTFDIIVQNTKRAIEYTIKNNVEAYFHIRVNIDKTNQEQFIKLYKLFQCFPDEIVCVHPGITKDNSCENTMCFKTGEYVDFAIDIFKKHSITITNFYPENEISECFVRNENSYLIGPNGDMYKCWHDLGKSHMSIGNVNTSNNSFNTKLLSKYFIGTDPFQDEACRSCQYFPICGGGCPSERFMNKYESKNINHCSVYKHNLKKLLANHLELKKVRG